MIEDSDRPIVVSGMARSGSTWMQWFLSRHPRVHIHGQEPRLPWSAFWGWYQELVVHGQWALRSNRLQGYEIAHYAGSGPARSREIFKRMLREYMTGNGPQKARWGLKWIGLTSRGQEPWQFASIWPETRWVVCMREPFATISSTKNTFAPDLDPRQYAAAWVDTCKFIEAYDSGRLVVVEMDKLAAENHTRRAAAMQEVLDCVGEAPCEATDRFVEQWPVVHKVTPDERRRFSFSEEEKQKLLADVPELATYMEKMGYPPCGD